MEKELVKHNYWNSLIFCKHSWKVRDIPDYLPILGTQCNLQPLTTAVWWPCVYLPCNLQVWISSADIDILACFWCTVSTHWHLVLLISLAIFSLCRPKSHYVISVQPRSSKDECISNYIVQNAFHVTWIFFYNYRFYYLYLTCRFLFKLYCT